MIKHLTAHGYVWEIETPELCFPDETARASTENAIVEILCDLDEHVADQASADGDLLTELLEAHGIDHRSGRSGRLAVNVECIGIAAPPEEDA